MTTPAYQLAQHLDDENIGVFAADAGWSIAVGHEPSSPTNTITVYDSPLGDDYFADEALATPFVQVRVRAEDYLQGYTKQEQIRDVFSEVVQQVLDDHYYIGVWNVGDILHIGRDDNNRFLFTANYRLERQPTAVESA